MVSEAEEGGVARVVAARLVVGEGEGVAAQCLRDAAAMAAQVGPPVVPSILLHECSAMGRAARAAVICVICVVSIIVIPTSRVAAPIGAANSRSSTAT